MGEQEKNVECMRVLNTLTEQMLMALWHLQIIWPDTTGVWVNDRDRFLKCKSRMGWQLMAVNICLDPLSDVMLQIIEIEIDLLYVKVSHGKERTDRGNIVLCRIDAIDDQGMGRQVEPCTDRVQYGVDTAVGPKKYGSQIL